MLLQSSWAFAWLCTVWTGEFGAHGYRLGFISSDLQEKWEAVFRKIVRAKLARYDAPRKGFLATGSLVSADGFAGLLGAITKRGLESTGYIGIGRWHAMNLLS